MYKPICANTATTIDAIIPVKKPARAIAKGKPIMPAPTVAFTKLKATSNLVRDPYPGLSACNKSCSAFDRYFFNGGEGIEPYLIEDISF